MYFARSPSPARRVAPRTLLLEPGWLQGNPGGLCAHFIVMIGGSTGSEWPLLSLSRDVRALAHVTCGSQAETSLTDPWLAHQRVALVTGPTVHSVHGRAVLIPAHRFAADDEGRALGRPFASQRALRGSTCSRMTSSFS